MVPPPIWVRLVLCSAIIVLLVREWRMVPAPPPPPPLEKNSNRKNDCLMDYPGLIEPLLPIVIFPPMENGLLENLVLLLVFFLEDRIRTGWNSDNFTE